MWTIRIEVLVLKTCFRGEWGRSETRVYFQSLEQKLLSNKELLIFFHKIKNKQHLPNLFVTYLFADDFVQSTPLSIQVNNENEIFIISCSITKLFECITKKPIGKIFPALQQKRNVVVCSKDAEVLVLMVVTYVLNKISVEVV